MGRERPFRRLQPLNVMWLTSNKVPPPMGSIIGTYDSIHRRDIGLLYRIHSRSTLVCAADMLHAGEGSGPGGSRGHPLPDR